MVKKDINLITQTGRERASWLKFKIRIKKYLYVFGGIFILLSAITLAFYLILSNLVTANENKITLLKNQISTFNKTESYLTTIADRIKAVKSILNSRKTYTDVLSSLDTLYVPGFQLRSLEISSQNGVKLNGGCEDLASVTNFNERLEEVKVAKTFSEIVLPSVSRSSDGRYTLSLTMKM